MLGESDGEARPTGAALTHRTLDRSATSAAPRCPWRSTRRTVPARSSDGDLVLLAGFGGGMSIGASLLRWSATGPAAVATG